MSQIGRSTTVALRPKPVDHRIEKRPFNACVLREGGSPFVGMRRSGGGTQRVVLGEEARERQEIRDMAVVLQQTSSVTAYQFLASRSTAASSLTVELLRHRFPRQLKNRCIR